MNEEKLNIEKNGFKKLDGNYFNIKNNILEEFEEIYKNKTFCNNEYENTSIIKDLKDLNNYKMTSSLYENIISTISKNNINNIFFDDIWFVKSVESIYEPKKLPYVPHIDKVRKFKAMVYLNDVTVEDGPLFITKINPNKYESFRKNLKQDYKKNQENIVRDIDIKEYLPLTGDLGTIIFFDTNAPHFAGKLVSANSMRKIIRFNFRYKKESKFKSFIKKIF